MPDTGLPARRDWRRTTAWVILAALCVSLGWAGMILCFGTAHPFRAVSGHSMLPTLRTGDLVVIRGVPEWSLRVGEIVAIRVPAADQTTYHYPAEVVHRISALYVDGTTLTLQTKGDSQGPDPFTVPASDVSGRMLFDIPYVGYGFLFLRSRQGHIAVIGLGVLFLLYLAITGLFGGPQDNGTREPREPHGLGAESQNLALAVREYGEHLRSHTAVIMELGGTTAELRRQAAEAQNDILAGLRLVVSAMATPTDPSTLRQGPSSRTGLGALGEGDQPAERSRAMPFPLAVERVVPDVKAGTGTRSRGGHRWRAGLQAQTADSALYPSRRSRKRHWLA